MRPLLLRPLALVLALLLQPADARAADPAGESRLRDALRTTTSQLRALEEEQARWQAREAQYQKEVAALKAEVAEARKGAAGAGDSRVLRRRLAEQAEEKAQAAEALGQCRREAAAEAARARKVEEERAEVTGRADGLASRAAACEAKNARMLAAGQEFLAWIAHPGSLCEPILGLRRVELENRAQALKDRLLDQQASR